MEKEVQEYNDVLFILFLAILLFNIYFLVFWLYRFLGVMLRLHAAKFKKFPCCVKLLATFNITDYESDLKQTLSKAIGMKILFKQA